jgi:hypothetical protein
VSWTLVSYGSQRKQRTDGGVFGVVPRNGERLSDDGSVVRTRRRDRVGAIFGLEEVRSAHAHRDAAKQTRATLTAPVQARTVAMPVAARIKSLENMVLSVVSNKGAQNSEKHEKQKGTAAYISIELYSTKE